jgi:hypothetical protein
MQSVPVLPKIANGATAQNHYVEQHNILRRSRLMRNRLVGDIISGAKPDTVPGAAQRVDCAIVTDVDMFHRSIDSMAGFFVKP